jgi:tRNA(adenine34) deaminase
MTDIDHKFMRAAIEEARAAFNAGEIPVGAVISCRGELVSRAHNENRSKQNPVLHAEIIAIEEAARITGNERLTGCDLYVTKEPCAMCAGAIIHARLDRVIISAEDEKYGACGSAIEVCGNKKLNHFPEIIFGVLREESAGLLREFFRRLRDS